MDHLPLFAGMSALKDNEKIADILAVEGALTGRGKVTHSYPHSWRSHAPLIFRNTPQWFISMESHGLRDTALKALSETVFYPPAGQTRLTSMIAGIRLVHQPPAGLGCADPVFVHKASGEPLKDQAVIDRVVEAFREEGADAWFDSAPERFLGDAYDAAEYEQVIDIVDVWFDSGSTHAFLLEGNNDMSWPADMYLEGSDQHRGWFHSSLLESCGTRGRAPYDSVLTHGFVLDEQGRKMSKSLGNTVTPQDVIKENGADILRIWVANSDYYDDLRIGPEIIQRQVDHYRRREIHSAIFSAVWTVSQMLRLLPLKICRNSNAGCWRVCMMSTRRSARPLTAMTIIRSSPCCTISATTTCRHFISISGKIRSIAVIRPGLSAGPAGR